MALISYQFDADLTKALGTFHADLYHDDAKWIPPLETELRAPFAPDFTFYRKPGNRHRHFIATAGGAVVGHVSAIVNSDLRDCDGTPIGAVGFFESIEDYTVAAELLGAATAWLRDEHSLERVWGPLNFDIWHGYRLMTRGFAEEPFYGEPYNKPYYPTYFEKFGFRERQRWNSVVVAGRSSLEDVIARSEERYRQAIASGYRFVPMNFGKPRDVRRLHTLVTRSYQGFLGYTPLSLGDFGRLYAVRRRLVDPRLMNWVYDDAGAIVGFSLAYPDYCDAVRVMRGEDNLAAKLRFLCRRRTARRAVYYLIGMAPETAGKNRGLGRAASYHTVRSILQAGYDEVVAALMAKGNPVRGLLRQHAGRAQKEYVLYELSP